MFRALLMLVGVILAGCGSSTAAILQPQPAVFGSELTLKNVVHEGEFAQNPQLRAPFPGPTLIAYLEASTGHRYDTASLGSDRFPLAVENETRFRLQNNAPHVQSVAIVDETGRVLFKQPSEQQEAVLAPGHYTMEIQSRGDGDAHVYLQPPSPQLLAQTATTPGVYVTELSENLAPPAVALPSMVVGYSSSDPLPASIVSSEADFLARYPQAGPALALAVHQYFANEGSNLVVATYNSADAATITKTLQGLVNQSASKIVLADFFQMPAEVAAPVALAALDLAEQSRGLLCLDLPQTVQTAEQAVAWRQQNSQLTSSRCALYWPGLQVTASDGTSQVTGASASVVGMLDLVGLVPSSSGGPRGTVVAQALASPYTSEEQSLLSTAQLNAVQSDLLVPLGVPSLIAPQRSNLGSVLILNALEQTAVITTQYYVFSPNSGQTWTAVVQTLSNINQEFWAAGLLLGDTPDQAYQVACGVGSTMTGLDVLNGLMIVSETLRLEADGAPLLLNLSQTMGS